MNLWLQIKLYTCTDANRPTSTTRRMHTTNFSFEHRWALDEAFTFHRAIGKALVTPRIYELNQQMKQGLAKMPHVTLHTPMSQDLSSGIVCFEVEGMTPRQVTERLRPKKIIASVTPYATQYARVAPSLLTSSEDIEQALRELLKLRV